MPALPIYRFRQLSTDSDISVFIDGFCAELERRSKGQFKMPQKIPVARVAGCTKVMGVFDSHGEMVAGYVINNGPDFFLLKVIPQQDREAWLKKSPVGETCELNLIWRNHGISHRAFSLIVWPRIISDCVRNGRNQILGSGYDNPLNSWYRAARPGLLYAGPSMTTGMHIYVYAYTRPKIVATYFASFAEDLTGRLRKRA